MTLTGIAADVRAKDHGAGVLARRIAAVVAMFAGGAVGALLVLHAGTAAGPVAGGVSGGRGERRAGKQRPPGRSCAAAAWGWRTGVSRLVRY
jgi:hypothetical protein